MEVDWKVKKDESPIKFKRVAHWNGLTVGHWRVNSGRMPEAASADHEINIVLAGRLETSRQTATGGTRGGRKPDGKVCLTPAFQPVAAQWGDGLECVSISFAPALISRAAHRLSAGKSIELIESYADDDPLIQNIGLALVAESETREAANPFYVESLTQTLLLHVLRRYSTTGVNVSSKSVSRLSGYTFRRVTEFINAHLEQELTLHGLAEIADLSQFHFARAFKSTAGLTPQQYITRRRIELAKNLLAKSNLPLVEISAQTGFKNQSHFTTLFRKLTAMTPKAWREASAFEQS